MSSSVRIEDIRYVPFPKCNHYADVGWLPRLNVRREYGSEREMREARDMLSTPLGWDAQYPAIVEVATEDEIKEILEKRQKDWDFLKSAVNEKDLPSVSITEDGRSVSVDGREYIMAKLACFEYCYADSKGKLKKPSCIGTTGNRRGAVLLDSMAVQLILARRSAGDPKLQPGNEGVNIQTHIFVLVPETPSKRFPDVAVRKQAQLRENETKQLGFKRMTDSERLEACLDLVENHGKSQSDVRNSGYGATLGLRLYFACVIDVFIRQQANNHLLSKDERRKWQEVRFLERLMAPQFVSDEDRTAGKVNPNWLDFSKFQQKSFQGDKDAPAMGLMTETDSKFDKENRRRASLKTPMSPLVRPTPETIQEWVGKQMWGGGVRLQPSLKRETIANLADRHKNPFVKDAMRAVDKNDESFLTNAAARADVCLFAYGCDQNVYERLAIACVGLKDLEVDTQLALLSQFVEAVEAEVATAEKAEPAGAEDFGDAGVGAPADTESVES